MRGVMRRLVIAFLAVVAGSGGATAHAATLANWDRPEQRAVARAGVLPKLPGGFHGEKRLTAAQLNHALAAVATRTGAKPVTVTPGTDITVATFHRVVDKQLGLSDLARSVQAEATRA